jgi:hypothetical protein
MLLSTNHIIDLYCIFILKEWYYLAFSNHNKNNVSNLQRCLKFIYVKFNFKKMLKSYICIFNFVSHFLIKFLWILKFQYCVKYIHIIISTN